jgi:hypothetical protein
MSQEHSTVGVANSFWPVDSIALCFEKVHNDIIRVTQVKVGCIRMQRLRNEIHILSVTCVFVKNPFQHGCRQCTRETSHGPSRDANDVVAYEHCNLALNIDYVGIILIS